MEKAVKENFFKRNIRELVEISKSLLQNSEQEQYRNAIEDPNLELELYEFDITQTGLNKMSAQTSAEHDRLLGVFAVYTGSGLSLPDCKFRITLNNRVIISPQYIDFSIVEKTSYISRTQAAYKLDVDINSSDINFEFINNLSTSGYKVKFYFICRKK